MEITVRELRDVDVVTVVGRVDSNTAPQMDQALKGLVDNGRFKIVLDLAGVEYMSSAGLRAMVSCMREVKKGVRLGDLRLVWTRCSRSLMTKWGLWAVSSQFPSRLRTTPRVVLLFYPS
jgi:anti-anti-sigma factor